MNNKVKQKIILKTIDLYTKHSEREILAILSVKEALELKEVRDIVILTIRLCNSFTEILLKIKGYKEEEITPKIKREIIKKIKNKTVEQLLIYILSK